MEKLATGLAVMIMACKTKEELNMARAQVQSAFDKDPAFKKEWIDWLEIGRDTAIERLSGKKPKESIFKDGLNCDEK